MRSHSKFWKRVNIPFWHTILNHEHSLGQTVNKRLDCVCKFERNFPLSSHWNSPRERATCFRIIFTPPTSDNFYKYIPWTRKKSLVLFCTSHPDAAAGGPSLPPPCPVLKDELRAQLHAHVYFSLYCTFYPWPGPVWSLGHQTHPH